jgi:HlyD family secretion protein/macrolide-specific efflux system membrane fusion protein
LRFFFSILLVGLGIGAGWFVRGSGERAESAHGGSADAPRSVRVARGKMEQTIKARGIVKPAPNALVRVGFPMPKDVARRISKLELVEGDAVKKGQVLAALDHADLDAELEQLKAQTEVFRRRRDALKALQPVETRIAEAALAAAQAQIAHARRVYDRLVKLGNNSVVSTLEMEVAVSDRDVAEAKLSEAAARVEQVREKFASDIAVLESEIEQARTAIRNIEVQIEWSTLASPIAGQVFAVNQHQGELTSNNPALSVLTLLDLEQLQLHLYVDEADFGRITAGQDVTFRVDAHPGETLRGKIVRLLPQPILQENVVYYLAVVDVNAEQRELLRSEMTALAYVQAGVKNDVLVLPLGAVRSRGGGWYVIRAASDRADEAPIEIGWKDEGRVEIVRGLNEGAYVWLE